MTPLKFYKMCREYMCFYFFEFCKAANMKPSLEAIFIFETLYLRDKIEKRRSKNEIKGRYTGDY